VTIDLEQSSEGGMRSGHLDETVIVDATTNTGRHTVLHLRALGRVRPSYEIQPGTLVFPGLVQGEVVTRSVQVKSLAGDPAVGLEVISLPEGFEADVRRCDLGPGEFSLRLTTEEDAPPGRLDEKLRFRAILDSAAFAVASIHVEGAILADYRVVPSKLHFGSLVPGQQASAVVVIQSRRGHSFEVERFAVQEGGVTGWSAREPQVQPWPIATQSGASAIARGPYPASSGLIS